MIDCIKSSAEVEEGKKCKLTRVNSSYNVRENLQKCRLSRMEIGMEEINCALTDNLIFVDVPFVLVLWIGRTYP